MQVNWKFWNWGRKTLEERLTDRLWDAQMKLLDAVERVEEWDATEKVYRKRILRLEAELRRVREGRTE